MLATLWTREVCVLYEVELCSCLSETSLTHMLVRLISDRHTIDRQTSHRVLSSARS